MSAGYLCGTMEEGKGESGSVEKKAFHRRTVSALLLRQTISDQSSTSSCSPTEAARYKLRTTPSRCNRLKMARRGRANWPNDLTKILLDLCIVEKDKLNFNPKKEPTKAS